MFGICCCGLASLILGLCQCLTRTSGKPLYLRNLLSVIVSITLTTCFSAVVSRITSFSAVQLLKPIRHQCQNDANCFFKQCVLRVFAANASVQALLACSYLISECLSSWLEGWITGMILLTLTLWGLFTELPNLIFNMLAFMLEPLALIAFLVQSAIFVHFVLKLHEEWTNLEDRLEDYKALNGLLRICKITISLIVVGSTTFLLHSYAEMVSSKTAKNIILITEYSGLIVSIVSIFLPLASILAASLVYAYAAIGCFLAFASFALNELLVLRFWMGSAEWIVFAWGTGYLLRRNDKELSNSTPRSYYWNLILIAYIAQLILVFLNWNELPYFTWKQSIVMSSKQQDYQEFSMLQGSIYVLLAGTSMFGLFLYCWSVALGPLVLADREFSN